MTQEQQMTAEQQKEWVREQYQVATKYLAEQGLVTESVVVEESRYLVPLLALWKLKALDSNYYWVICGDVPSDFSKFDAAPNAREAVRHFSYKWQLQAENLLRAGDKEQEEFAQLLVGRAEGLYKMYEQENLWGGQ